jgi:hypothetical protein
MATFGTDLPLMASDLAMMHSLARWKTLLN